MGLVSSVVIDPDTLKAFWNATFFPLNKTNRKLMTCLKLLYSFLTTTDRNVCGRNYTVSKGAPVS